MATKNIILVSDRMQLYQPIQLRIWAKLDCRSGFFWGVIISPVLFLGDLSAKIQW
ncbi:hypothetical protein [Bartonella taylorii]|uniref:hypothetical protein n=1 Tax=Bartonella taylorii TaxID=33046 RepID=UPI001ABB6048|nr:hypothetical protein [Bartonella taylorii]